MCQNCQGVSGVSRAKSLLSDGAHLVIVSMAPGHVTKQGHYIVLAGWTTINGKGYFKVYDPHRWNEYYKYDGEIIDDVKDDGYILLSETAVRNEGNSFLGFSNRDNSGMWNNKVPSTEPSTNPPGGKGTGILDELGEEIIDFLKSKGIYDWFVLETQKGNLSSFFDTFGFFKDKNGVYHAKQDGWQSSKLIGYNDFYDMVFAVATSMDKKKFEFSVGKQKFIIWLWKGDYLNLGAGAEIGIYYGGGPHWLTGVDYAMPMTLALYDNKGKEIFNWKPGEDNWWCTGFNPNYQKVEASNLNVYGSIDFSGHLDMWKCFYDENNGKSIWGFDPINHIAKFKW